MVISGARRLVQTNGPASFTAPRSLRVAKLPDAGELLQTRPVQHFRDVEVAGGVCPDAVRAPELTGLVAARRAVATDELAREVDDAELVVKLRHVHLVVLIDVDLRRAAKTGPHVDELPFRRED